MIVNRIPAGHWYNKEGIAVHQVTNKTGGLRNTTLADARKMNLYPSVTTILKVIAKPELEAWKQEQAILSALTLPRKEGESEKDFAKRVVEDSSEQSKQAADFGTTIHNVIENHLIDKTLPSDDNQKIMIQKLDELFVMMDWKPYRVEDIMVGNGFAGKFDLMVTNAKDEVLVIDFKTQSWNPGKKPNVYGEWLWQLGAYSLDRIVTDRVVGGANIVINKNDVTQIHVQLYNQDEIQRGRNMFLMIRDIWQNIKDYFPE